MAFNNRRVVITGMGAITPIGLTLEENEKNLRVGLSGAEFYESFSNVGMRSHVAAPIHLDPFDAVRAFVGKESKKMGPAAAYAYLAARMAIAQSGLKLDEIAGDPRIGLIAGSGGASTSDVLDLIDSMRDRGIKAVPPSMVPRIMSSTVAANLAVRFGIRGISYSISSACATATHCIGEAYEKIMMRKQSVMIAGGAEEIHWTISAAFDAMRALSTRNNAPKKASRPWDKDRDGFVSSGGGGMVVLESLEHALARGATILAEIVGYGITSDGADMVKPSGEGAVRCMQMALGGISPSDVAYINAHGTSTPTGDIPELEAIGEVFGNNVPSISSTKSQTGHALGAAGAIELIFTILMMRGGFIAPTINIETLDPKAEGYPIVQRLMEDTDMPMAMSNSFGFGGTNATLLVERWDCE